MTWKLGSGARTDAMMLRSPSDSNVERHAVTFGRRGVEGRVARFDRVERSVHWATALIVIVLITTGAILYIPAFSAAIGRRLTVEDIHVYFGLAVFAPVVFGLIGRWGRAFRSDLREMNRLNASEISWLRSLGRRGRHAIGKFNPGQKLNTSAIGGMLTVLLLTGIILRWGNFLPVSLRTGATFIHDVFAIALSTLVVGHVIFALAHPRSLRSMVVGWVPDTWLGRHAPAWGAQARQPLTESAHEAERRAPARHLES